MLRLGLSLLCASLPALAGEYVVLSSGLRLHVDRHENSENRIRLFSNNGTIDLPAEAVVAIEAEEQVAAAAPQPQPELKPPESKPSGAPEPKIPEPKTKDPRELVRAAAVRSGLPAAFVESVAKVESSFQPRAVSPKGAIGVMQLMPDTAQTLGVDPRDTEQNIEAGARLLRDLLIKYDGDVVKALSAYNAGEGAVDRYHGMPPYPETQQYVNRVVRDYLRNGGQ